MTQILLIVESPAKARTLNKYLGKDYTVKATVGHVIDLPKKDLGVDVEKDFTPKYVTIPGKAKVIKELKEAAKKADMILLAPDPDREGEAIAWHVAKSLAVKNKPVKRVLFNEITKKAVLKAIENPSELDEKKFASQQARRILDRLVGYKLSPFLWKKVKSGLSAGRVQSVAVRVVWEREQEIRAFVPREYWNIFADLEAENPPKFRAKLIRIGDDKAVVGGENDAVAVKEALAKGGFAVSDLKTKQQLRRAAPPFITSSMQQAASSRLRMTPRSTMAVAQMLYEGVDLSGEGPEGLITYMRTDSVRISPEAQAAAALYIKDKYGDKYLPAKPNFYKSGKRAQEAHEAIRPTRMDAPPERLKDKLNADQFRLYELIWNRFVASQMAPALFEQKNIEASCDKYVFNAVSTEEKFPGHLAAYRAGGEKNDDNVICLPEVAVGDSLKCLEVELEQKFTQPPSRFSEAALIRELEERGIGRPSTYASIMSTIQDKGYVEKEKGLLHPTPLGEVVTKVLIESFPSIMEIGFTASMEDQLDDVEEGSKDANGLLTEFYGPFEKLLDEAAEHMKKNKLKGEVTDVKCEKCDANMVIRFSRTGPFLACSNYPKCKTSMNFKRDEKGKIVVAEEENTGIACDKCGAEMTVRFGRGGQFLACSGYPECKSSKNFKRDEDGKIVVIEDEATEEKCEKCGKPMIKRQGRWGPYLACSGYPECKNIKSLKKAAAKPRYEVEEGSEPPCPKCGKPTKLRVSRYGSHFWSCSTYPKCRGTLAYDTGFACPAPDCDGTLVERLPRKRNEKKQPFWACSKCEYISNDRPIKQACPKCGNEYVVEHRERGADPESAPTLMCAKDNCDWQKEPE